MDIDTALAPEISFARLSMWQQHHEVWFTSPQDLHAFEVKLREWLDQGDRRDPVFNASSFGRVACSIPTREILHRIAELSPLVEVGSGTGLWAFLLDHLGADITIFDLFPPELHMYPCLPLDSVVAGRFPHRTLLMCYPQERTYGVKALNAFTQAGGGCFALIPAMSVDDSSNPLVPILNEHWELVEPPLLRDPKCSLYVYHRKGATQMVHRTLPKSEQALGRIREVCTANSFEIEMTRYGFPQLTINSPLVHPSDFEHAFPSYLSQREQERSKSGEAATWSMGTYAFVNDHGARIPFYTAQTIGKNMEICFSDWPKDLANRDKFLSAEEVMEIAKGFVSMVLAETCR